MAVATSITYTYRDRKGKIATTKVNVPSATNLTDLVLFATEFAQVIDPLLRGALIGISACIGVGVPLGVTTDPFDDADVEEKLVGQFRTQDGWTKMALPTVFEDFLLPTGEADLAEATVALWVDSMVDGIDLTVGGGSGIIQPTDSREEDIIGLDTAYEYFRASGPRR